MWTPIRSRNALLVVAAAVAVAVAMGGAPATAILWPLPARAQATTARVRLHVGGMHCATCPITVRLVLQRLPGVHEATVSATTKRALVVYDPRRITPARMVRAIADAGYRARIER
ncbi:MAG: heavy-metal-associated domain-containing protein [Deltaproteobacteria bacterium]|nr:heavy-metal-associated domain-containing protein [Deltaproteobacteria bacterium]